jgi:hypothetical protein
VAGVVPFAGANDDAHVIVFPGVGYVRQIFIRTVEVNVVILVGFEKRADVESATQADEMAHQIRVSKGDVAGMIGPRLAPQTATR